MIELLKYVVNIDNFNIVVMDKLRDSNPEMFRPDGSMKYDFFEKTIRPFNHIYIRNDVNSITFNLKKDNQDGCYISTMMETCSIMLQVMNGNKNNESIKHAISLLNEAIEILNNEGEI